jgi:hypothetical protein
LPHGPNFPLPSVPKETIFSRKSGKADDKTDTFKKNKQKNVPERTGDACVTSNYSDIHESQQDMA